MNTGEARAQRWLLHAVLVPAAALSLACTSLEAQADVDPAPLRHSLLHFSGEELGRWREAGTLDPNDGAGPAKRVERSSGSARLVLAPGERFESPVIAAEEPFVEALASWNVVCPGGAGFRVELSARRADDRSWSPWLQVGEWGAVDPALPRAVEFDGGRIDVDFLAGDVDFDALRFAVVAEPGSGSAIEVERVSLCLTGAGVAPVRRTVERSEPPRAFELDVRPRSQRVEDPLLAPRICSPTCVAMVLSYHGVELATADVAALLYDARHDIYGNWTRAVQGAFACGVPGYLQRFSEWSEVEALVARGVPLVVSVQVEEGELPGAPYGATPGHLLVLAGFDARGNVVVDDPAAPANDQVRRVYARRDLSRVWLAKSGVAYVLGDPRPSRAVPLRSREGAR